MELIKRLLHAIESTDAGAEESTPRRRFARFLQQLVASRIWERRNAGAAPCGQQQPAPGGGPGPAQPVPALAPPVGPHGPMGPLQTPLKAPHFDMPAHDMQLPPAWDAQAMNPEQIQSLFAFSDQDIMPNFMAFPDQTSSWFM